MCTGSGQLGGAHILVRHVGGARARRPPGPQPWGFRWQVSGDCLGSAEKAAGELGPSFKETATEWGVGAAQVGTKHHEQPVWWDIPSFIESQQGRRLTGCWLSHKHGEYRMSRP